MIKYFKLTTFLIFIICSFNYCFSQQISNFKFVEIKEGITKRAVTAIKQDKEGFLWFGTNGAGLYRYDGITYKLYEYHWDNYNSINSGFINAIFEDSTGKLWITTDEGLNLYNKESDNFKRIDLNSAFPATENYSIQIKSIAEANTKELILGTYGHGLFLFNKSTYKSKKLPFTKSHHNGFLVNSIIKFKEKDFFIGTSEGLYQFNFLPKEKKTNTKQLTKNQLIESQYIDSNDNLWIGTQRNGLLKIDLKKPQKTVSTYNITDKRILSITEFENTIICGTENEGLIIVNKNGKILKQYLHNKFDDTSLKSNSVWSLLVDREQRIWLGFYNQGVSVIDKLYTKFNTIECLNNNTNSLQSSSVTGIKEDKQHRLWITTDGGGVDVFNKENGKFIHINNKETSKYGKILSNDVTAIYIDKKDQVWLGAWTSGLTKINIKTKQNINYSTQNSNLKSNRVLSIQEDSKGKIWIGTFLKGLHYLDPKTNTITHCNTQPFLDWNLNDEDIRRVFVDIDDDIWLGTLNGLFQIKQLKDNKFQVISLRDKMSVKLRNHTSTHRILSIYQSNDKLIWIGTDGGGLFSYNKTTKKFNWYNKIDGFNELYVSSIIESNNNNIWVAGTGGITKLDRKNNTAFNITKDDGLLANDFNYNAVFKNSQGKLYFGNYLGVNYFNPDKLKKNTTEPKLFFTDFKLFNKSVKPSDQNSPLSKSITYTKKIVLNSNQSVFTIDYIGLNYTRPEKNKYAYFMEGVDPEWNFVGNAKNATYTNLSPGNYTFNVKAANNDGVWNKTPLKLYIKILPPWYASNFAYFLYFLVFLALMFLTNWLLQERFKEKQAVEFERDKRIQEEKLNDKKLQFFTNISHEFRTPLTLILNPLQDLIKDKNLNLPTAANEKLQIVQKNADRLNRLINELMDFRKLKFNKISLQSKNIEIVSFVKDLVSHFKQEASHRKIDLVFTSNEDLFTSYIDKEMIEKVLFNIISNAFKVTPDKGKIIISAQKTKKPVYLELFNEIKKVEAFEIVVQDTGAGLNKKELTKIFERFYQLNKLNKGYYGSTGIGLEVVKDFVELHKGKIDVSSKVNEGTKFKVTLPLITEHVEVKEEINNEELTENINDNQTNIIPENEIAKIQESDNKSYTVLIVEDNIELSHYLKSSLSPFYKIITASNGKIGLEKAISKLPDIILTDLVMPEMDGIALCKAVKTNIKTSHIPLLMLTAKSMIEDKIKGIDSGADAYISKPFNMEFLKSTLCQLLSSRQIMFNKFYTGVSNKTQEKTTSLDNKFIQKLLKYIENHIDDADLSAEILAKQMFLSRSQLYRKLKTLTGTSVNEFIRNVRLEKAKQLLETKQFSISEITFKVGFSSPSYFTKCFKKRFRKLPTEV
ncbi:hybrid sensor histidine kinase/response regulator [Polaribacter butkevichii]|uniref:histidine kinase n=1 Tax=Polaribacter butkevichii TaxID=218490 RepID=A0A2P6CEN7_9FLAO|nr:two-component regulator propeller domain-containing protein [Polaribacter butkevichii]PQJ73346.1 hybrid sensor histidine kinase/response regulator [Polaribacter butkevichii]